MPHLVLEFRLYRRLSVEAVRFNAVRVGLSQIFLLVTGAPFFKSLKCTVPPVSSCVAYEVFLKDWTTSTGNGNIRVVPTRLSFAADERNIINTLLTNVSSSVVSTALVEIHKLPEYNIGSMADYCYSGTNSRERRHQKDLRIWRLHRD
jgi:hypothetical protein